MPIFFIGEDYKTFIHLIYRESLQDKADMIKLSHRYCRRGEVNLRTILH